jgi:transcriptional regulator with XRE-family HTH domain
MTAKAPPQVSIRAVREAYGLSIRRLIDRIAEQGVEVQDPATIRNVETGNKRPSTELLTAWAKALKLNPSDVRVPQPESEPEEDAA